MPRIDALERVLHSEHDLARHDTRRRADRLARPRVLKSVADSRSDILAQHRDECPSAAAGQSGRDELDARESQWRGEDQIAAIVDAASGPKFYDHDARGRLVRERRPDAVVERAIDAVGNVYRTADGRDRRYGRGGRLEVADSVRYEHDEDGNQTLKSGPDGDWRYRWNGHGMLREVERPDGVRVAFEYDPFARRTAKRVFAPTGDVDREV